MCAWASISAGLSRSSRQVLLDSGAAAREAFATYVDMQCAVYEQFPLVLTALAHVDVSKAREKALRMADAHDGMGESERNSLRKLAQVILDPNGATRVR